MKSPNSVLLKDRELLEWLKKEKFDVAFSHMYNTCPIGLIHKAKIPSWIWLNRQEPYSFKLDRRGKGITKRRKENIGKLVSSTTIYLDDVTLVELSIVKLKIILTSWAKSNESGEFGCFIVVVSP